MEASFRDPAALRGRSRIWRRSPRRRGPEAVHGEGVRRWRRRIRGKDLEGRDRSPVLNIVAGPRCPPGVGAAVCNGKSGGTGLCACRPEGARSGEIQGAFRLGGRFDGERCGHAWLHPFDRVHGFDLPGNRSGRLRSLAGSKRRATMIRASLRHGLSFGVGDWFVRGWNQFAVPNNVVVAAPADGLPRKTDEPDKSCHCVPERNDG